eukprot:scaffold9857_cov127-Cylindrotheca_fusiformis.AAC.15
MTRFKEVGFASEHNGSLQASDGLFMQTGGNRGLKILPIERVRQDFSSDVVQHGPVLRMKSNQRCYAKPKAVQLEVYGSDIHVEIGPEQSLDQQ